MRMMAPTNRSAAMSHYHAVVWLDHQKAHVLHFNADEAETEAVTAKGPNHLVHNQHHSHQAGTRSGQRTPVDHAYYDEVVKALGEAKEWLVMGPAEAKTEFARHVAERAPTLAGRIVAVESADHPSEGQILARARSFFRAADRMRPQRG
jgi:stalled ribosome rescue protein Dom34